MARMGSTSTNIFMIVSAIAVGVNSQYVSTLLKSFYKHKEADECVLASSNLPSCLSKFSLDIVGLGESKLANITFAGENT